MGFQASVGEGTPSASMLVEACVRSALQMYNHGPSVFFFGQECWMDRATIGPLPGLSLYPLQGGFKVRYIESRG